MSKMKVRFTEKNSYKHFWIFVQFALLWPAFEAEKTRESVAQFWCKDVDVIQQLCLRRYDDNGLSLANGVQDGTCHNLGRDLRRDRVGHPAG